MKPETLQELYEDYIEKWLSVIGEFSGSICQDNLKVYKWSKEFAKNNNLKPYDPHWEIYIDKEDL